MSDPTYCYPPDFTVLRNRFGIQDAKALKRAETQAVAARMGQPIPTGEFDLDHLKRIHRHLFQDVYEWAGQTRTTSLAKGESHFLPQSRIEMGMADVHKRLAAENYLTGLTSEEFAQHAATIVGDVNYVHPFREGNGRTQFHYLKQLAAHAGHPMDLARIEPKKWIDASIAANKTDYGPMAESIHDAIIDKQKERQKNGENERIPPTHRPKDASKTARPLSEMIAEARTKMQEDQDLPEAKRSRVIRVPSTLQHDRAAPDHEQDRDAVDRQEEDPGSDHFR